MIYVQRKRIRRKVNDDMLQAYLDRGWLVIGGDNNTKAKPTKAEVSIAAVTAKPDEEAKPVEVPTVKEKAVKNKDQ